MALGLHTVLALLILLKKPAILAAWSDGVSEGEKLVGGGRSKKGLSSCRLGLPRSAAGAAQRLLHDDR